MNDVSPPDPARLVPAEVSGIPTAGLAWKRLTGGPRFSYPIDYAIALLRAHEAEERVEFLVTWPPGAYCHFHQHLGPTRSIVIAGSLHVDESGPLLDVHKVRRTGHETANDGGDVHMEHAGPEGAAVYYDMRARDGRLFDILGDDGAVLNTLTYRNFLSGDY